MNSAARTATTRTVAVATRVARTELTAVAGALGTRHSRVLHLHPRLDLCLHLLARAPVATLTHRIRLDRHAKRRRVEVRPEQVGEIELGVRELPEQEIGNPLLAAGADEQVRLGRVGHRKIRLCLLY